ncbi:MAG: hypothetical protein E4H11_03270 [Myxococcales bacterium]|nr:MAG: hypothetical protein E4H11_03270 [Myxococcales bacterium]
MHDRPRERLDALGPEALGDSELLALLLRTGGRGADALAVASQLLRQHAGLLGLARASPRELSAAAGVGPAKQATLRAAFELGRREAAAALVLVHNHPSGDPAPSAEDREVTARLVRAGELLGVPVLDHVVVAERGYTSLRELGLPDGSSWTAHSR